MLSAMLDDGTVDETLDDATVDDDSTTTVAELFKTKVVTQRLFHTNSGSGEPESHGPSTPHSVGKRRKLAEESTTERVTAVSRLHARTALCQVQHCCTFSTTYLAPSTPFQSNFTHDNTWRNASSLGLEKG